MAIEKFWESQGPEAFTADGGANGVVTVGDVLCFKVKQNITIYSDTQPDLPLQVKRVLSFTQLVVGPKRSKTKTGKTENNLKLKEDISAYTVADNSGIRSVEQPKTIIPIADISQATFEHEPANAIRTMGVDKIGQAWSKQNPIPVDFSKSQTGQAFNTFLRDGLEQIVTEDVATPANNRPLPVKLTGFSGDVAISADNLNIHTQQEGEYNASSNDNPDNVGLIVHERSAATNDTHQTRRPTAVRGTSADNQTVSQDISIHDHDGNRYSSTNRLPIGVHGPTGTQIGNISNSLKVASDSLTPMTIQPKDTLTDAFGRSRVSERKNIFEWQFRYDVAFDQYWDQLNLNGATQLTDEVITGRFLNGAAQIGSRSVIQSRRYIEYIPGNSKQIFFTGNFEGVSAEWVKRYGTFDDNNGLFFELNGIDVNVVVRSSTTGVVDDIPVSRTNWNGDKLDGSGASGFALDFTKQQLFFIDYAYLGTGDVRFGFYINGKPIIAHTVTHANILTTNYMQSGILPIRCELEAIGTPSTTESMQVSCISIAIEGESTDFGRVRAGDTGVSQVGFGNQESIIFGVRLNPLYPYTSLSGVAFQILPTSGNSEAIWRVYQNPTLAGPAPTWANVQNSLAQTLSNSPGVSGGHLLASGYVALSNNTAASIVRELITDIFIGRSIDGTPDTLVLTLESTSGNGTALFAGQWKEIL